VLVYLNSLVLCMKRQRMNIEDSTPTCLGGLRLTNIQQSKLAFNKINFVWLASLKIRINWLKERTPGTLWSFVIFYDILIYSE